MYDVQGTLPVERLDPGTSVLCRGPPMAGKRELGVRTLADGLASGEETVAVTAQRSGSELLAEFEAIAPGVDTTRLAVVDCASGAVEAGDSRTVPLSSPADLTGTGMTMTNALQDLDEHGVERTRVLLDSVSTRRGRWVS